MTQEQWMGILRHGFTLIGGILIAKGVISESAAFDISGVALTLIGLVWSVIKNRGITV